MSDKPEKIEWKKLQASNGDSYYGYFNGLQVAYIIDVGLPDEYILNFGDNSKPEYFNAVGLAKGRGEEMLAEWLLRADLAKPSEWISVDDRLPEELLWVSVATNPRNEVGVGRVDGDDWCDEYHGYLSVTHWQYKPPPPARETP